MKKVFNVILISCFFASLVGTAFAAECSKDSLNFSCEFEGTEDYVCELVTCEGDIEKQQVLVKIAISHALPEHELKLQIWDAFTRDGEPYSSYIKNKKAYNKLYGEQWEWTQYETSQFIRTERPKYVEFMITSVLPSHNNISVVLFKYYRSDISYKEGLMVIKNIPITWK